MSFKITLDLLKSLKDQGRLFVSLAPPFNASFEVERALLPESLQEQGLTNAEFKKQANQIGAMLLAILDDSVDTYIEQFPDIRDKSEHSKEELEKSGRELQKQVDQVRDLLYAQHLQLRYDLKKSSKAPSFSDIDWDVKVKHYDGNVESLRPFPYATCRIKFQREFDDSIFVVFGGRAFDSVQVNFSVDEVDYLLRVFATVKERLEALENGDQ